MKKNYLLSSIFGCLFAIAPVSADVIGMSTATKVGEKLSIALNENVTATVAWGDGTTENIVFKGSEVEIVARHADFTLTTDNPVTFLYCPSCNLTALDVTAAPDLTQLVCPDNQLAELDVKKNTKLEQLNCSGNQLSSLILSSCRKLEYLDVSHNALTTLSTSSLRELKTFLCADNKLQNRLSMLALSKLETLWCYGNELSELVFADNARPLQICAFDNQLESLTPANLEGVKTIWLDNNKLTTINLEDAHVEEFSASNNLLSLIVLNDKDKKSLQAFYVDGNQLMLNSLPTVFKTTTGDTLIAYNVENQRPFYLTDKVNINEKLGVADYTRKNGWGYSAKAKTVWKNGKGEELEKNVDYKISGSDVMFLHSIKDVYAEVTSPMYPNVVFEFAKFQVVDPTGIEDAVVENSMDITAENGQLVVSCSNNMKVSVYSIGGALLVNDQVTAGTHSWNLPAGVYIVNGKKIVLGR